ncbi:GNAT family N-acetyltransferase [Saliterribacillus persicus]|uniref:Ribosomal protein S18 acetylase RimI-like enzyme n=1 Tax=Saliterribacillus persicus TaxID=930114 RepID=A0A368X9B4_9BACI|nr:GNAT family N-acetyltransferase [Saliterribacillus persicus]RCW64542.1 ribosomal protein S18 acetylase RimI-like enzyme [Saliterribacillus persicus]
MTVRLEEMSANEFQQYLSFAIKNFADEQIKSGNWEPHEAISNAKKEYEKLLPEGQNTENHNLFTIRYGDKEVGVIWIAERTDAKGFIYDINIWEESQCKGYGKKAMQEIEIFAKENGMNSIGLHVFGHNKVARYLYEKLGYRETNIKMEKTL